MLVADRDLVRSLLRCPRTGRPLEMADGAAVPVGLPAGAERYPVLDDVPFLVLAENSVLDVDAAIASRGASVVHRARYAGPTAAIKRLLSPQKAATRGNVTAFAEAVRARSSRPLILVVGGGTMGQGLAALYEASDLGIVALDIYASPVVHVVADAHDLPFADDAFDGVVIQAVLEHVLEPQRVVAEIWRVLKPGGVVYAETPFMQQVHEGAYDFTRFTELGHRYLFRRFEEIRSGASGGPGLAFMWSVDNLVRGLFRSRTAGKIAKLGVFWAQYLDRLIPEAYRSDGASGVYFMGAKAATALPQREVARCYHGAQ